ncbi:MAG TPA: SRPBCC domain-containing protein [Anaerolineales bacterium]|jgi:uncharacterized protein YndB with AHSA1/START domain|nr:SRPBCC domain-containing protein [Anaerolineales bacterium]
MDSVTESIYIRASKAKVFEAFVNHIGEWWPFKGKFSYSFAPESTQPKLIQFEARTGGRFYETFANGEQYEIGTITAWQPPDQLSFTWKGEEYKAPTLVEVQFTQAEDQTKITLTHSGWEAAGLPDYAESYGVGWEEILGNLSSWLAGK